MKAEKGFTLIELLVVVTIIATLAAFMFANFAGARERARDVKRKNDLEQVKKALRLYYNDTQSYPAANGTQIASYAWNSAFATAQTTYMALLPVDPVNDASHQYRYYTNIANTDSFLLVTTMENGGDPDIAKSKAKCTAQLSWVPAPGLGTNDYVVCAD